MPNMKKHAPAEEMKQDLDNLLSKINALEIISSGEFEKGTIKIMRTLVEDQLHSINEFEHLKKAIDLLTLQLFEIQNKTRN